MDATRRTSSPETTASAQQRLGQALRQLAEATRQQPSPAELRIAHADVARVLLGGLQDPARAEWHLQQALASARKDEDTRNALDLLCQLGRAAWHVAVHAERQGDHAQSRICLNRARDYCFEAIQALGSVHDAPFEARLLDRIAHVLADCGDQDDAEALLMRARRLLMSPAEAARTLDACPLVSAFGALG